MPQCKSTGHCSKHSTAVKPRGPLSIWSYTYQLPNHAVQHLSIITSHAFFPHQVVQSHTKLAQEG